MADEKLIRAVYDLGEVAAWGEMYQEPMPGLLPERASVLDPPPCEECGREVFVRWSIEGRVRFYCSECYLHVEEAGNDDEGTGAEL